VIIEIRTVTHGDTTSGPQQDLSDDLTEADLLSDLQSEPQWRQPSGCKLNKAGLGYHLNHGY
jgi:hypothetical protein